MNQDIKKPNAAQNLLTKLGVVAVAAAPLAANAAIDVSEITTLLGEGVIAAAVIGLGFLGLRAGIAIYKNLRSAA